MKNKPKRSPSFPPPEEGGGLLKMNLDPIIKNIKLKENRSLISQIRVARNSNQFNSTPTYYLALI